MVRVCETCVQKHLKYCTVKEEDVQDAWGPHTTSEILQYLPSRTYHDRTSNKNVTVFAASHCEKIIEGVIPVEFRVSTLQASKLRASVKNGLSAIVHLGYLIQPYGALQELNDSAQTASKMGSMEEIMATTGGARTSELRYFWRGLQSAMECQCGIEGEKDN